MAPNTCFHTLISSVCLEKMTIATPISTNSQTQEMTEKETEKRPEMASVGVGRETTSIVSPQRQATSEDECKYVGDIYAEKKHGHGVLSWPDGRMYTGAFYADQRHGFGNFQTPDVSEFRGLYRYDERFGPGILIHKFPERADVGFWLSEDLVRLLYPHPSLHMDIEITDRKSSIDSNQLIPSWYSPEELLSLAGDHDFILRKKNVGLFCHNLEDENSFLTNYLIDHSHRIDEVMQDKRAQLDAYLSSIHPGEKFDHERMPDIFSPNQTFEQRQLFDYVNKFWPLKQRASFSIEELLSNTRSAFPNAGPLETSSLTLMELAFQGQSKGVRDLLMQRRVYVDVCDSRGLTSLHFATYNVHIKAVNVLLDFGANVNQLSDDGLTVLSIAFLLYYGNNPEQTINTALEHADPVLMVPRPTPVMETRRSSSKDRLIQQSRGTNHSPSNLRSQASIIDEDKIMPSLNSFKTNETDKKNSYGYQLNNDLHERIDNETFREAVCTLIKLLLRRGADPSISDWPLPVLALAVRAGDKEMVELLLKKKAQVNCRLNAARHVYLTPLHIACGCLSSNTIDVVRLLIKFGANVNAQSLPGGKEYLSLADPTVLDSNKIIDYQEHGRSPLHIACTREASADTLSLVRVLLEHHANPNAVCNGQTSLSLAIACGNQSLVYLLLDYERTDPSTPLGLGNGNALCSVLATVYEPRWPYAKRIELIERLIAKSPKVLYPIRFGPKNTLGSAVDYSYYSYFADTRISQTPYHSLLPPDRVIFKERKELLAYIAKRFREEVSKYDDFLRVPTPIPEGPTPSPSGMLLLNRTVSRARSLLTEKTGDTYFKNSNEFHYCATCGRSINVRLTPCKRCRKVCFCSKACKVSGWNAFHRDECQPLNEISPSDRLVTSSKTISSKNKLPNLRPNTHQTDGSQFPSVGTSGTRFENFTGIDGALFKDSILNGKTPQHLANNSRLPNLSVAKLIRQKRLKKMGKLGGNLPPTLPVNLEGAPLSWNPVYHAPENYSFN